MPKNPIADTFQPMYSTYLAVNSQETKAGSNMLIKLETEARKNNGP